MSTMRLDFSETPKSTAFDGVSLTVERAVKAICFLDWNRIDLRQGYCL